LVDEICNLCGYHKGFKYSCEQFSLVAI
jgi:hypothetical protein